MLGVRQVQGHRAGPEAVAMLVYNNCTTDARVQKEAASLAQAGLRVTVVAVLDPTTVTEERREGFEITRIERDPIHYRVLRRQRRLARGLRPLRLRRLLRPRWRRASGRVSDVTARVAPSSQSVPAAPAPGRRGHLRHALMRVHQPLMFVDYYFRAYRLLRGRSLHTVHAHDLNTLPVAVAVARSHGARLVYDSHELYTDISTLSERERWIWRVLERWLIHQTDQVVTVCESIADELVDRYRIAPPLVLLNCPPRPEASGGDRDTTRLRAKAGLLESSEPIVLYQGGFAPHRGLETLVRATQGFDRGVLVLMGWGRLAEQLSRLIDQLEVQDRVVITDPVPREELLSYTRGADVGVIPYKAVGLNNYYSTPNKLFEYMAAGVPIVSSRFPELRRFVEGLDIGRTFDPERTDDLAAAVNFMLADPIRHQGMRDRALAAAQTLNWESEVQKLLHLYGVGTA